MDKKLIKIKVTIQDIWAHTRPAVVRNKKKYNRKKFKKLQSGGGMVVKQSWVWAFVRITAVTGSIPALTTRQTTNKVGKQ